MTKNKVWLNIKDWEAENKFRKERQALIFPLMNKTDEEIEAEVRALEADGSLYVVNPKADYTILTNRENIIQFEIALRKEVRRLLNK